MSNSDTYLVCWNFQEKEINHYCFQKCGKIIFGAMHDNNFGYGFCYEKECPYEEKIAKDFGYDEIEKRTLHLRKLKELEV